jgi:hypothetical protein
MAFTGQDTATGTIEMFDTLFSGMMAYQQILMLISGFACLALGVLIAGNEVYWRRKAVRVAGIIAGVRHKGNVYYPVYRYQLSDGSTHEATSDTGSSGFAGKETGRLVPLLVFENDPTSARPSGSFAFGIAGMIMVLIGGVLIYLAFTRYPITQMSWFMAVALFCYSGMKLQAILVPKGQRLSLATWKAAMKQKHEAEMQGLPVQRIEDMMTTDDGKKQRAQQARTVKIAGPLLLAVGAFMLWGGVHVGNKLEILLQYGLAAPGQVAEMQSTLSSNSDVYYPVVSFTDAVGHVYKFKDENGQNPPEFAAGDTVNVIYLPSDPGHSAIIDRGPLNYLGPMSLLGLGTVFCIVGGVLLRRSRRSERETAT